MIWKDFLKVHKLRQFLATICLGPTIFGASLSWTSPVLPQLQNQNSTISLTLTVKEGSWVASMLAFGVLFTAIPAGYLVDRFGVKRCILAAIVPNVAFAVIVCFSKDVYSLCIARFISGMAVGATTLIAPIYIADMSEVSLRGILVSFYQLSIFIGIIFVSVCGALFNYIILTMIVGTSSLIVGIIFLFLPESPTYLLKVNKKDEALLALKYYRSDEYDVAQDIDVKWNDLQNQSKQEKVNVRKVLMSKAVVRSLAICVGLTVFHQLSGIDAILFYIVYIFQETQTNLDAYNSAIILSIVQLLTAVSMVFVIEKAVCLGPTTLGASLSWTSPVLPQLQNQNSTISLTLTVEEGSWVASMLAFGVLFIAVPAGYLVDRFGIKRCIVGVTVANVAFAVIVCFSKVVYSLYIARFISGMAVGAITVISPIYIADISEVSLRGILVSFYEFSIFIGIIFVSVCGALFNYVILTMIVGTSSLILGIMFLFLPESPTYLLKVNNKNKALLALKYYRNVEYDVAQDIDITWNNLQNQSKQENVNVRKVLMSKSVVRGLTTCIGLTAFQQLSGIDAILFYIVHVFQETQTHLDAYNSAIILSMVQLLTAVIMVFIIEKAGRRMFLYFSALFCGLSLTVLGIYFNLKLSGIYFEGIEYIPILSLMIHGTAYSFGLGAVPWLINGELLFHEAKGVANVLVCLGSITFGAYLSWTSPVLPQLQNQNSTMPFTLTVEEGSWVGSMLAVGILCSSIPSGYLADRFGLKRCIIALIVPNAIFTLIVYFSKDVYSLCIGRFISGTAAGGALVIAPMYIADISEVSLRGSLGSFFSVLIYVGIIFVTVCGAYVNYITLTIILGTCFVMLGIALMYFPESPTYLIKVGRKEQAILALKYYRSDNYDVTPDIDIICKNVQQQSQQDKVNIKKVFTTKSVVRGVIACVGLTIFQQLSAIDAIIFYTVQIFREAETDFDSYTSAIIFSVVQLLSGVVMVFLMNKAGRRTFLYLSVVVCGLSLATLGLYFHLKSYKIYFIGISYIPLISLIVYGVGFAIGIGPVPWLMNGELLSPKIKGSQAGLPYLQIVFRFLLLQKRFQS
ncbi:hypothetical protein FQR65_LT05950 [Abscondita terminalis]|nr:hypothetical protein FQR65_LT05950 [Abscondita terminalis]